MSKSFVCEDADAVDCPSTWQSNRSLHESAAQTSSITLVESGVQSRTSVSAEVQTDSSRDDSQNTVDMSKLAAWLDKITPRVLEELDKVQRSRVFDEYKLQNTADSIVRHLFTLSVEESHPQFMFATSAVDWSSTGGTIAVARSAKEHSSWCDHLGTIFLYQSKRQDEVKPPYRLLDVSSCVTALSAHPSDSFILACGSYSGEVTVWNLQRDDPTIIGNVTLHGEAVVHLEWIENFDVANSRPVLASVSRDGSVIIWAMKSISNSLKPFQCFILQAEKEDLDLGIICAKFNPSNPSLFLAGVEGGSVVVCNTDSRHPCRRKQTSLSKEMDCYDPVQNILDGHRGTVTGVQWVSGSKDLFLSSGTDSQLHVYSLNEMCLLRIIHLPGPASGLEIIPSHPSIALVWSSASLHLHDIHTMKMLPALALEDGNDNVPLSVVRVRSGSSLLFALGSSDGKVSIWQVPHIQFTSTGET